MDTFQSICQVVGRIYQTYQLKKEIQEIDQRVEIKRRELENAQNIQPLDPFLFSCVYQGDEKKEIKVRSIKNLKKKGFEAAKQFLEQQSLTKQVNFKELKNRFYDQQSNTLFIDLEKIILNPKIYFIDEINQSEKLFQLNLGIDNMIELFILYFQGLIANEVGVFQQETFLEITDEIYRLVIQRAQKIHYKTFDILIKKFDEYSQSQFENNKIKQLCHQIMYQKLSQMEINQKVLTHFLNVFEDLRSVSNSFYTFQLCKPILNIHFKKIQDCHNKAIIESQMKKSLLNEKQLDFYSQQVELRFVEYLLTKQFVGGINEENVRQNLSYLILSLDWTQNEALAQPIMDIFNCLQFLNFNVSKSQCRLPQILQKLQQLNKQNIKDAQAWWKSQMNENKNIKVIFQIYINAANIKFVNNCLQIGVYSPLNRLALIQILQLLNENNNTFLVLLNFCEIVTHQIQLQIQRQLEKRQNRGEVLDNNIIVDIQLSCNNIELKLLSNESNKTLFFNIQKPIRNSNGATNENFQIQNQKIQERLQLIAKRIGNSKQMMPNFNFEVISEEKTNSNVITFLITGFLTKDTNRSEAWSDCNKIGSGPGTVIALNWQSSCMKDIGKNILELIGQLCNGLNDIEIIMKKLLHENVFNKAESMAEDVGLYLAYLVNFHNLFGGYQINIIVHSLGSVVLRKFINILDQIMDPSIKFINDILILGGAEDINMLANLRWNSVAGRVFNIYSNHDKILKYFLSSTEQSIKPCGLQPIRSEYKLIINEDFTYFINGHTNYSEQLTIILKLIGFNNDYVHLERITE